MAFRRLRSKAMPFALAAIAAFGHDCRAAPPPVEAYAALPFEHGMRLSPNGKKIAVIMPRADHNSLVIFPVDKEGDPRVMPTDKFEPNWLVWKTDDTLIASLRFVSNLRTSLATVDTRLISINADFTSLHDVVRNSRFNYPPQIQDRVVSMLPNDPEHILIEMPHERERYPDVLLASVTGERPHPVLVEQQKVSDWMSDPKGVIRLGTRYRETIRETIVRDAEGEDWRIINKTDANTGELFRPIAFSTTEDKRLFVLSERNQTRRAIWEVDTTDGKFLNAIASDEHHDVEPIVRNNQLVGYHIADQDHSAVYLDKAWQTDYLAVRKALADQRITLIDRTSDGVRALIVSTKNNQPNSYWVLDRSSGKAILSPIAQDYPQIEPEQVAPAKFMTMSARDGLRIPMIVTLPIGYTSGPIPFVVLPHGGPTAHDNMEFWFLTQFIASRGYGVMQPQFRGSTGYGRQFELAGLQQWGLKMQDDITDATKWLIDQKLADPERICIVGWSYGGYASLMGAVKEPALYKCSVAIAPVSNLRRLVRDWRKFLFADVNIPRIGQDRDVLEETSPSEHADQIRIPVLLIHGKKDYTVPIDHSEDMESALRDAKKSVQTLYFDNADHYLVREEYRRAMLKAVEGFLATNLGPGFAN